MSGEYHAALKETMAILSTERNVIFVGQGVGCAGTTMTDTLDGVPKDKLLEFPVAEDLQMGTAIGMALGGWLPVCIFPRWNFLLCAANQLVNHLDRLSMYSNGAYNPHVIIRTAVPIVSPFYPGPQHSDDFTEAFEKMLYNVRVIRLTTPDSIGREYARAAKALHSTLLVEYTALYNAVPSGVAEK
jgi:pyruvate/2-oxoglutarate/acetoin dehydrogenase E1 component